MKRKRKVYGAALPPVPRRDRRGATMPCLCYACGQPIDRLAVMDAIEGGVIYAHGCGRRLA